MMRAYTIFRRPLAYPSSWVLRGSTIGSGTVTPDREPMAVVPDEGDPELAIETIRNLIPDGLHRFERHPEDEPQIVETWL